jgi:hypothetical protein
MAQTNWVVLLFAFIAFWASSRADAIGQNLVRSALLYSHSDSAQVARQRCLILYPNLVGIAFFLPFVKGTSLLCR